MTSAGLSQKQILNYRLLVVIFFIAALGVSNVYSATANTGLQHLWKTQIVWLVFGFTVALGHLTFDYRVFERVAYPFYGSVVGLLVLVLIAGKKILGARRWLSLGFANFQPSELMKVGIIFVLARYFAEEQREQGYTIRDLLRLKNVSRPLLALCGLVAFWSKNVWLADPIGELSRHMYIALDGHPPDWDGSFLFRVLIITALAIGVSLALLFMRQIDEHKNAFEQLTLGQRRLRLALWFGPVAIVGVLCWMFWQSEFLGDPQAVIVSWLVQQGSPLGGHAEFAPVLWFRLLLLLLLLSYLTYTIVRQVKKGHFEVRDALAPIDLVLIPMALIMAQPDLGTAMLVGSISFSIILFVGMRLSSVALLGISGIGLAVVAWFALLHDYQKQRVLTFLDPEADARGTGYHANQSIIAVGSGRLFGKGFASGTQSQLSFLPEQHTDFAFSVWSEEHGFAGGLLLVAAYFVLIVVSVGIAARARDKFGALLVTGFTALLFWQAFVNMGMVIGLLPIVGVPLPLFSYGGSSLLTVMVGFGIMLNVHYRRSSF